MANVKDWLNQKFNDWEKTQGRKQSYYAFARFLDVSQSGLAQWMIGSGVPAGDDVLNIAAKLGPEVYDALGMARPNAESQRLTASFAALPPDIRSNLTQAIAEVVNTLHTQRLRPDSADARRIVLEILNKWGFKYFK